MEMETHTPAPKVVRSEEGQAVRVLSEIILFKILDADTNEGYLIIEVRSPAQQGVPPHIQQEDETHIILEGTHAFQIGDQTLELGPGAIVFVPRGTPHGFTNIGTGPARLLQVVSPGANFEQLLRELGEPIADPSTPPPPSGPPDLEKIVAVAGKYGLELLPPPTA
jgi:quercetin dioxygenase-like cupin family protein